MMAESIPLRIHLKDGPLRIPFLNGAGVRAKYTLWEDITASEFYPAGKESAVYEVSLRKEVTIPTEVYSTECELKHALDLLAMTWPFSGGSFLVLESRSVVITPRYQSNAKEVEADLWARSGLHMVGSSASVPYGTLSSYRQPPLCIASQLAKAARADPALGSLLRYHQQAWEEYYPRARMDRSAWFINLYKVRDTLSIIYNNDRAVYNTPQKSDQ